MWGALKHLRGASEHRIMGVLRGTLDRGPLKHQIGSFIWDNVKHPIRSFRAPFVLFLECSPRILSRDRGVQSWSVGSSSNSMRTALMASGSGMLVNSADTSYAISFCPGGISKFLTLSTKSPLFWVWRFDLPTRGGGQKYLPTHGMHLM